MTNEPNKTDDENINNIIGHGFICIQFSVYKGRLPLLSFPHRHIKSQVRRARALIGSVSKLFSKDGVWSGLSTSAYNIDSSLRRYADEKGFEPMEMETGWGGKERTHGKEEQDQIGTRACPPPPERSLLHTPLISAARWLRRRTQKGGRERG